MFPVSPEECERCSHGADVDGGGVCAGSGSFGVNTIVITSSVTAAPAFTTQPTGQTVTAGSNASFTATASGTPMPTYQWQASTDDGSTWTNLTDTAPYGGTATDTLTISGATMSMSGHQCHCVATNAVGSATSSAATLSVSKKVPVIWPAPAAITYPTPLSGAQLNATANVPARIFKSEVVVLQCRATNPTPCSIVE